jgi:hypothetical protein
MAAMVRIDFLLDRIMARSSNRTLPEEFMKAIVLISGIGLVLGCRGESVPRDYQNTPPAVTHPADDPAEAPGAANSTAMPEPTSGAEGTSAPYEPTQGTAPPAPSPAPSLPENAITTTT